MKFTFKTEKTGSGRYASFFPDLHHIKFNKVKVGTIGDAPPHRIRLTVKKKDINEDGNPNCEWKWIRLKGEFQSLQEAKDFLNKYLNEINEQYELYCVKD